MEKRPMANLEHEPDDSPLVFGNLKCFLLELSCNLPRRSVS